MPITLVSCCRESTLFYICAWCVWGRSGEGGALLAWKEIALGVRGRDYTLWLHGGYHSPIGNFYAILAQKCFWYVKFHSKCFTQKMMRTNYHFNPDVEPLMTCGWQAPKLRTSETRAVGMVMSECFFQIFLQLVSIYCNGPLPFTKSFVLNIHVKYFNFRWVAHF